MSPSKWLVFIRPSLAGFHRPLTELRRDCGRIGGLPFLAESVDLGEVLACLNQRLRGAQR